MPLWTAVDVQTWLCDVVRLPQYADAFGENEVDGGLLLWLKERNLEHDLGVSSGLHRRRILEQLDMLRPPGQPPSAAGSASIDGDERRAAAVAVQTAWRGRSSRVRFGKHVDIIRRYEQLRGLEDGADAGGADAGGAAGPPRAAGEAEEEEDVTVEVSQGLKYISEQLREQLATSKATQPPR